MNLVIEPMTASSLSEMLARRVALSAARTAFTFGGEAYSYGWIDAASAACAGELSRLGVGPGSRVVVAVPNGPDFFAAFFGAIRAGATAVPTYPNSDVGYLEVFGQLAAAAVLIVPGGSSDVHPSEGRAALSLRTLEARRGPASTRHDPEFAGANGIAVLQYTSGSTADPKGVMLSHHNLLTNVGQMVAGMALTADDVFVSWLPVCHDMGLVLMTLAPLALGAHLVLLAPSLRTTSPWLEAIERHRGTFTAAPDFAWRLVVRHRRSGLRHDLSSLRVALNAAEPVRAGTIGDFEEAFGLSGVMASGYGLAEATVGVSMTPPGTRPAVDGHGRVSVGLPFPGIRLRIDAGARVAETGEIGEIVVRSPANCAGYFRNPAASAALLAPDAGIRTGDLGYLGEDGSLYFAGRRKSLIIQAGRSLHPGEVEEAVEGVLQLRATAAVGAEVHRDLGEQLYVLLEVHGAVPGDSECDAMIAAAVARIHARFGLRPARVYVVAAGTIPFTRNGKKRYPELRRLIEQGGLPSMRRVIYPPW
jgi:fatty-acyl-CoA synthase